MPIRHLAGHLLWSAQGAVWAIYRLHAFEGAHGRSEETVQGTYVPAAVREELLGRVTHLVRSLSGAPRLFGLCAQVDPGEIAWRMVDGVDPGPTRSGVGGGGVHPWVETVEAALDLLEGQEMHRRTLWLAVPLNADRPGLGLSAAAGALWAEVSASLGMRPAPVSGREVAAYREQAARVEAQLGGSVAMRPARPAEVVWMVQHALFRGLAEPLLAEAEASDVYGGQLHGGTLHSPSYADLGQVRLAEGGTGAIFGDGTREKNDARRGPWWRSGQGSPLARRWLQVETETGTGYQAHLALAECPPAVAADTADLFAQLESLNFPVDTCVDLMLVPAEKAKRQVQRKRTELVDQGDQYDARPTGMPASLLDAAQDLGELERRLSRTSVEVEVQSVTALTVWGPTAGLCDARARALGALLKKADYRAVRPAGLQEALFALGLPGTVRPSVVREFVQHQVSEDWAMGGAFTTTEVGDPTGTFIGIDLDSGTTRPVLVNLADAPKADTSASFGIVADPGAGKSVMEKLLTQAVVDRGERAICIDRTPLKEWATFARSSAAGRCQIIDVAGAALSIDPLRVFAGQPQAAHYALSYLTLQLGIGPMTAQGGVLHRAVEQAAAHPAPSMRRVVTVLEELAAAGGTQGDTASSLVNLLQIVANNPLAAMVFDPALPVVRLDAHMTADMIVFTTAGLTLPPQEAFGNTEILRQQPLEALIGRAVLYLIAAIARQTAFTDAGRFCALAVDEMWWLTSSAEGTALVSEFLHDGRKHGAGLIAGAQADEELGPDRGLMAYRALGRTTDRERARGALKFIGLDSNDKELLRLVTTQLSPPRRKGREGEVLLTCPRMNTGRIKVIIPAVARIAAAIHTTPAKNNAAAADLPRGERGRKGGKPR